MRVIFTDFVGVGRGSIGFTTYSKTSNGNVRKLKALPTNPQTIFQMQNRANFAALSSLWRMLTEPQRQTWINASPNFPYTDSLGQTYFLSGNDLFLALNLNLLQIGFPINFNAPTPQFTFAATSLTASVDTIGGIIIDYTPTPVPPNHSMIVRATAGFSPGIYSFDPRLRIVTILPTGTASPQDITVAYVARLGLIPAIGSKVGFGIYFVNTLSGESSANVELKATAITT